MGHFGKTSHAGCRVFILSVLFVVLLGIAPATAQTAVDANTYAFNTSQGTIYVELRPDVAPKTVANFLAYVNSGAYNSSIFHRLVQGFILQGGGYYLSNGTLNAIAQNAPVVSEYSLPNVAGTLAMAHAGTDPNSATNQWFFNLADNTTALSNGSSGQDETVFGQIVDPIGYTTVGASMAVLNTIAADQVINDSSANQTFSALPVINYTSGSVQPSNLVYVTSITQVKAGTLPPLVVSGVSATVISSGTPVTATIEAAGYPAGASVNFTCSSLPADSTCTFTPNPVIADAGGAAISTVTIKTGVQAALECGPSRAALGADSRNPAMALVASLTCVLTLLGTWRKRNFRAIFFGFVLCTGMLLFSQGCGGSNASQTTPPTVLQTPAGSYSIVISATAGSSTSSTTLAITVN